MKMCKNCNIDKDESQYCKRKEEKDGLHRYCKLCMSERGKNEYNNDKETHLKRTKKWREKNKEKHAKMVSDYYHNNKDYFREWNQNKMETDPLFRLRHSINALINHHLKTNKSKRSIEYLGCTIQEYKLYIEPQFTSEMNWDNYGSYWEIDHIHPLSKNGSFHYTNTQPLTINDNRTKSNKI